MTDAATAQQELDAMLKQQDDLSIKIAAQLKATREASLASVKNLCKMYKITATELKGALFIKRATAAAEKATPRKSKAK
jgi:hypothetical protein